ncbi:EAL domain-containing protein [Cupriavidus basilensis]|uniref:EAL domain-containing protein n=1 Tax=Cupriavidus basilensis TaxID=68895 RepID=A0ABT6B5A9_9BURK|nr:EAL domain-containing protein [Cupriavidus basilensis]MDF3839126.1 EAL domain-containing protein [Cupriavidus basilensis]
MNHAMMYSGDEEATPPARDLNPNASQPPMPKKVRDMQRKEQRAIPSLASPVGGSDVSTDLQPAPPLEREPGLLAMCMDKTDNPVMIVDGLGAIRQINASFTHAFGYAPAEAMGRLPRELLRPVNTPTETIDSMLAQLKTGRTLQHEALIPDKQGRPRWYSCVTTPVLAADERLENALCVLTEITDTKVRETIQNRALEAMVRDVPTAEILTRMCRQIERMVPGVIVSVLRLEQGRLHPVAAPSLPEAFSQAIDGLRIGPQVGACGAAAFLGEAVLVRDMASDPRAAPFRELLAPLGLVACWSSPIRTNDGRVLGTFAIYYRHQRGPDGFQESMVAIATHLCVLAFERDRSRERIRELAFSDSLTGLPNRQSLLMRADEALLAATASGSPLSVLVIEIDKVKHINGFLGQAVGDHLLCEVATRVQTEIGGKGEVGRLGSHEFGVILPQLAQANALGAAQALVHALAQPLTIARLDGVRLSVSIGVSVLSDSNRDRETLFRQAELAMYQARKAGRNMACLYDAAIARRLEDRQTLEKALRIAVSSRQLTLHYQPQIDLASGRLWGLEALARWQHPQRGEISAHQFIPLAEESGLITEIGNWAIQEGCRQLSAWRAQGLAVPTVSVNLSPISFRDPDLIATVARSLRAHGLSGGDLTVEITEGVLLDHTTEAEAALTALHELGVRLSIDDFGTGFSSLSRLIHLPVNEIKLDRSFLADLHESKAAQVLVDAVIRIGRNLDLSVVAEGVTTDVQRQFLAEHGCHIGQGFLFSHPLEASAAGEWLASNAAAIRSMRPQGLASNRRCGRKRAKPLAED